MRKRRRYANDNGRRPFGPFLTALIAGVAIWVLIVQGVAALLKAIFG